MSIAILILIFIFVISIWGLDNFSLRERLLLNPYRVVKENHYHTLITSGFVHGDWLHLIFNAVSFYFFALPLEDIVGLEMFLIIYFGSLILSGLPDLFNHYRNPTYRSLGASGAISGAMFAYILYEPASRISLFLLPVAIPAPIFAVLYLALSYFAARNGSDYINHDAHLWGAISGAIIAIILNPNVLAEFVNHYIG